MLNGYAAHCVVSASGIWKVAVSSIRCNSTQRSPVATLWLSMSLALMVSRAGLHPLSVCLIVFAGAELIFALTHRRRWVNQRLASVAGNTSAEFTFTEASSKLRPPNPREQSPTLTSRRSTLLQIACFWYQTSVRRFTYPEPRSNPMNSLLRCRLI
jgi:hypothetical protein